MRPINWHALCYIAHSVPVRPAVNITANRKAFDQCKNLRGSEKFFEALKMFGECKFFRRGVAGFNP